MYYQVFQVVRSSLAGQVDPFLLGTLPTLVDQEAQLQEYLHHLLSLCFLSCLAVLVVLELL